MSFKSFLFKFIVCIGFVFLVSLKFLSLAQAEIGKVKNVIIMIADGSGFNHVDAASFYQYGKKGMQVYDSFPVKLGMAIYSYGGSYTPQLVWSDFEATRSGITDSAASATAIATGMKTYNKSIGVDIQGQPLLSVMERAEKMGKMTGVVTSVQFSHATPAAFVAHNISRDNYSDIAQEMILNSATDVIMGCGHPMYDANGRERKDLGKYKYVGGKNFWNDLIAGDIGNDANGDGDDDYWVLIQSREEFQSLMQGSTPSRVMGIARVYSTLQQGRRGDSKADPYSVPFIKIVPTLKEMTNAALNVLDEDPDGFVLMVEGGAIDWASHGNQSGRMIEEQMEFNVSVEAVVQWVESNSNWNETLLIVTADHETGYLNGPGSNPDWNPIVNDGKGVLPGMEWHSKGHTNSLVPFFAKGALVDKYKELIVGQDSVYGPYIDNSSVLSVLDW